MIQIKVVQAIWSLFKPVSESLSLLQKIDKKIDAQAASKLKGQLRTLEMLHDSGRSKKNAIHSSLSSFNESSEYYYYMLDDAFNQYLEDFGTKKIKHMVLSPITHPIFGRGSLKKPTASLSAFFHYAVFWLLSEIGALLCMQELDYPNEALDDAMDKIEDSCENIWSNVKSDPGFIVAMVFSYRAGLIPKSFPESYLKVFRELDREWSFGRVTVYFYINQFIGRKVLEYFTNGFCRFVQIDEALSRTISASAFLDTLPQQLSEY